MSMTGHPGVALSRCLERALTTMNEAVGMTAEKGPAKAIEYVADFLNNTDAVDDEMAKTCPEDWLTRWKVELVCPKCKDDGYVDESTLSVPVICDCSAGVAKSKERQ